MFTHAAFLRGMNVGGHRITNDDLRTAFAGIGFEDVGVYRASGNVAFDGGDATDAEITERIEQGLEAGLGYAVPTFVRTADQMRAMATEEPFDAAALEASKGKLQVLLLRRRPGKKDRQAALALATADDLLSFGAGAELYWLPSGGTLDSELDHKALDGLTGVVTQRTKGTVEQITKKFFAG